MLQRGRITFRQPGIPAHVNKGATLGYPSVDSLTLNAGNEPRPHRQSVADAGPYPPSHGVRPDDAQLGIDGGEAGGGAIRNLDCPAVTVINCTFSENLGSIYGGGGLYNLNSTATVSNCIFWGDTASSGHEIYNESGTLTLNHCDIEDGFGGIVNEVGGTVIDQGGNIVAPPLFIDAENSNLRLQQDSPDPIKEWV